MTAAAILAIVVGLAWQLTPARAEVTAKLRESGKGNRIEREASLSNGVASYTLTYRAKSGTDGPNRVTSDLWVWTNEYVTVGMTGPSGANWYRQGFFNWYVNGTSLHNRRAAVQVERQGPDAAAVQYTWDLPAATVHIRFALTSRSDKLLMLGRLEPTEEIRSSRLKLLCYPGSFSEPRKRRLTTARRTVEPTRTVTLDLPRERWALYEDVRQGRDLPSAGLLVGTPGAVQKAEIRVTTYPIYTTLQLEPSVRSFALGLFDAPTFGTYRLAREYFRRDADRQAKLIGRIAERGLEGDLPEIGIGDKREEQVRQAVQRKLDRPVERWRPNPEPPGFGWARDLPGAPLQVGVLCRRWAAWEAMELARRLEMDVEHVYLDSASRLSDPGDWPYSGLTGVSPTGMAIARRRALSVCRNEELDIYLCSSIRGDALPRAAREALLQRVRNGAGLVLVGRPGLRDSWPEELTAEPAPALAERALDDMAWRGIHGLDNGERGAGREGPPVRVYRYGDGRVLVMDANTGRYGSLVPLNDATEGLEGAADRALALSARALMVASGREMKHDISVEAEAAASGSVPVSVEPGPPEGCRLEYRLQDGYDRVLEHDTAELPLSDGRLQLPRLPAGPPLFLDLVMRDSKGQCIGFASATLESPGGPTVDEVRLSPATRFHEPVVPRVDMPDGGTITSTATVHCESHLPDARLEWQVRDSAGRLVARTETEVPASGGEVTGNLNLLPPVTPCHSLDVSLRSGGREVAFARRRFTVKMSYPHNDFTSLIWTYPVANPVVRRTREIARREGIRMCDLSHVGSLDEPEVARIYGLAARSGLRLVPYIMRINCSVDTDHRRNPCLHAPAYLQRMERNLTRRARQAAPYSPAGFTLGDENYLARRGPEGCLRPDTVRAFREWLRDKYGSAAEVNRAWAADYDDFAHVEPMLLEDAARQEDSFAPWLDFRRFMDSAFADVHRQCAGWIRDQVPGAKVGWDGLLSYHWQSGYDFSKMTRGLDLNQTYLNNWLQGELVRSMAEPRAFRGRWGNRIANREPGWKGFSWACLLNGDQSAWWWTSWGTFYCPFNPDLSLNTFARWFFPALREVQAGPGRLLLHAAREDSGIGILYAQRDLFAAVVAGQKAPDAAYAGGDEWRFGHRALMRGLEDLGYQYRHVTPRELTKGTVDPADHPVLFLPLAACLGDREAEVLRDYVEAGGTLVADGRAGILTADGRVRRERPLDGLLGIDSPAGASAFGTSTPQTTLSGKARIDGASGRATVRLEGTEVRVLQPGIRPDSGRVLLADGDRPLAVINRVGDGRAVTLNLSLAPVLDRRAAEGDKPLMELLSAIVRSAGRRPFARIETPSGGRPRCIEQVMFRDGRNRYLALQADIRRSQLPEQQVRVTLPEQAVVYDVRAGQRIGDGATRRWTTTLRRGEPRIYSLLPHGVEGIDVEAPERARAGRTAEVKVRVRADGQDTGFCVVRLDVYAPGADDPHRHYSRNIDCPGGSGTASIPVALDAERGTWCLRAEDVATGRTAECNLRVAAPGRGNE